jgi:hypothetical protein
MRFLLGWVPFWAYRQGYWHALDVCLTEIQNLDPEEMDSKQVRLALYHRVASMRPPSWSKR